MDAYLQLLEASPPPATPILFYRKEAKLLCFLRHLEATGAASGLRGQHWACALLSALTLLIMVEHPPTCHLALGPTHRELAELGVRRKPRTEAGCWLRCPRGRRLACSSWRVPGGRFMGTATEGAGSCRVGAAPLQGLPSSAHAPGPPGQRQSHEGPPASGLQPEVLLGLEDRTSCRGQVASPGKPPIDHSWGVAGRGVQA